MNCIALRAVAAATSTLLLLNPAEAGAQQRPLNAGPQITHPSHPSPFAWESGRRFRGRHGFGGLIVVEREVPVIVEREVVREVPVVVAPPLPPPPPRKPYVVGTSYASLPTSCMKLIEEGVSYYYCGGEWYRQMGAGRSATYKAVAKP